MMLSLFSNLLSKESDLRVIDNLCAALCRMILSHVEGVPLEQVTSIFFKEWFTKNKNLLEIYPLL